MPLRADRRACTCPISAAPRLSTPTACCQGLLPVYHLKARCSSTLLRMSFPNSNSIYLLSTCCLCILVILSLISVHKRNQHRYPCWTVGSAAISGRQDIMNINLVTRPFLALRIDMSHQVQWCVRSCKEGPWSRGWYCGTRG